MYNNCRQLHSS